MTETSTGRYCRAAEARDIDGLLATLSPDVVLRSPITDQVAFRGREEIRELLRSIFTVLEEIKFFADVGDERTRALFYRGRIGGQPFEEATRAELDDDRLIRELTLYIRPLPGLATFAAVLAPHVARKHGRLRSFLGRVLIYPLGLLTRLGDRLVPWFA